MERRAFSKGSMRLTKNEMARVIVQALYNLPGLPAADNRNVIKKARQLRRDDLASGHELALKIIQDQLAAGTHPSQRSV